jgi:hypothetical protein
MKILRIVAAATIVSGLLFSICCGKTTTALQAPDNTGLQPYIHYFTIVTEGVSVSPDTADVPGTPTSTPLIFKIDDNLQIVFFVENEISGTIRIWKDNNDEDIIFSEGWHFPDETSRIWSNLMRPPNTTFYENRIELGKFELGYYVLNIRLDNGTSLDVDFKITT